MLLELLVAAGIQSGGWGYAAWGQSPEEVVRASAGAAWSAVDPNPREGRSGRVLVEGRHARDGMTFAVKFRFQRGGLSRVDLTASGEACGSLQYLLIDRYGDREGRTGISGVWEWRFPERNTEVRFSGEDHGATETCQLSYAAILHAGNADL